MAEMMTMMSGPMGLAMGAVGLLFLAAIVLSTAALVKYLMGGKRP